MVLEKKILTLLLALNVALAVVKNVHASLVMLHGHHACRMH